MTNTKELVIENGIACHEIDEIKKMSGKMDFKWKHTCTLMDVATPDMTFEDIYSFDNGRLIKL